MTQKIIDIVHITEWQKSLAKNKTWYFSGSAMFGGGRQNSFKMWNRGPENKEPPLPDAGFYNVTGSYDERGDFIIEAFSQYTGDISGLNFSPMPPFMFNLDMLNAELCSAIDEILTPWLHHLVIDCLWNIDDAKPGFIPQEFKTGHFPTMKDMSKNSSMKYLNMWAATHYHHAYRHGWLIHTLEVMRIAVCFFDAMVKPYGINESAFGSIKEQRELVIAASILHDIGKGIENMSNGVSHEKTPYGKFSENDLDITVEYIQAIASSLGYFKKDSFTKHMWAHLIKAIRGHHGTYGNQKPLTFVAQCLCSADGASSHMAKMRRAFLDGDHTPRIKRNGTSDTYFSYAAKVV